MDFQGGWALVTGGSGGLGAAIALELARRGADVVVHYHENKAAAERVVRQIEALGRRAAALQADLGQTEPEGLRSLLAGMLGTIAWPRWLVCSAGIAEGDLLAFMDLDDWDRIIRTNLRGTVVACQAVLPEMIHREQGSVVFIGSEAATQGSPGLAAYAASKAGLIGLARTLALEVAPRQIRVNVVAAGPLKTAMLDGLREPQQHQRLLERPQQRIGQPEEVARAVCFLLSEEASYITGQVLAVNGGLLC